MKNRYKQILEKVITNVQTNNVTDKPGDSGQPPPVPPKNHKALTKVNLKIRDAMANKANNTPTVIINPEDQSLTRTNISY